MERQREVHRISSDERGWRHEVRDVVEALLDRDQESTSLYLIALSEIMTNAEQAHERTRATQPVDVEIDRVARQVVVRDHGGGFDPPTRTAVPDPSETGGRGLHLASVFCPGLSMRRTTSGMEITLPFP